MPLQRRGAIARSCNCPLANGSWPLLPPGLQASPLALRPTLTPSCKTVIEPTSTLHDLIYLRNTPDTYPLKAITLLSLIDISTHCTHLFLHYIRGRIPLNFKGSLSLASSFVYPVVRTHSFTLHSSSACCFFIFPPAPLFSIAIHF